MTCDNPYYCEVLTPEQHTIILALCLLAVAVLTVGAALLHQWHDRRGN